jgi:hypothetical protein
MNTSDMAAFQEKKRVSLKYQILLRNAPIFNHPKIFPIFSVFLRFVIALKQTS